MTVSIHSGFAEMREAAPIIAEMPHCPWCLTPFDGAGPNARALHLARNHGEHTAVRIARAFEMGKQVTRLSVARQETT